MLGAVDPNVTALQQLLANGSPAGGTQTQMQAWIASLQAILSALSASYAPPTNAPSAATAIGNASSAAATAAASLAGASKVSPAIVSQNITAAMRSATMLLSSVLAAALVSDVATSGCGVANATAFQQQDGTVLVTGTYDAATVAEIQSLFPGATIPAACAPATTSSSSWGVVAAIVVGAGAIASAVYFARAPRAATSRKTRRKAA